MTKPNEGRLEAIAFNALQESRKAHGVGEFPWSDKDARLQAMITKLLAQVQNEFSENDFTKLTPETQAPVPKPMVNVEELLERIDATDEVEVEAKRHNTVAQGIVRRLNEAAQQDADLDMRNRAKTFP